MCIESPQLLFSLVMQRGTDVDDPEGRRYKITLLLPSDEDEDYDDDDDRNSQDDTADACVVDDCEHEALNMIMNAINK